MAKPPRPVLALLLLAFAVAASGCAERAAADDSPRDDGRPVVLTTFTVLADMARVVAGDRLRVESVTKPGAEVHGYEPTPDDLRRAAGADLVLDNGLGLEAWFEDFLAEVDAPHAVVSEGVQVIPIGEDVAAGRANPHAWMSPVNATIYVRNIARAFERLDPAGAEVYARNAAAYARRLQALRSELVAELRALPPRQRALVTCEGAFSYLARDAGLTERYLWPVNAEQQATPQRVSAAIAFVRDNAVPAVFCESTVSDRAQRQVAREGGARFGGVLYVDSLSGPDGPVPTYLDLLRHDTRTIVEGLTGGRS